MEGIAAKNGYGEKIKNRQRPITNDGFANLQIRTVLTVNKQQSSL